MSGRPAATACWQKLDAKRRVAVAGGVPGRPQAPAKNCRWSSTSETVATGTSSSQLTMREISSSSG